MLLPSIFGENLFDDFMDDFTEPVYGRGYAEIPRQAVMKTDIRETETDCILDIDLPGYKNANATPAPQAEASM